MYGKYTGHHEAGEEAGDGNEEEEEHGIFSLHKDDSNTSYEDVDEEATPSPVNFHAGKKMQWSVHFSRQHFSHDHVHCFVLDSPLP